MVRTPDSPQNSEAVDLIDALKRKLGCDRDEDLAKKLSAYLDDTEAPIQRNQFSKWRTNGLPKNVKALISYIVSTD